MLTSLYLGGSERLVLTELEIEAEMLLNIYLGIH